jgi:hypothetical protein
MSEKEEEKEHDDKLEQGLIAVCNHIIDSAQVLDKSIDENINIIA